MDGLGRHLMDYTFNPKEDHLLGYDEPFVDLIVGPNKVNFKIRRHTLAKIPLLDRMLKQKGFREGSSNIIELPEDNARAVVFMLERFSSDCEIIFNIPSVFTPPANFTEKLNNDTLPVPGDSASEAEKEALFENVALHMHAYVLADKMLVDRLRDCLFRTFLDTYGQFPPSLAEAAAIARLGHRNSGLYAFMISAMVTHINSPPGYDSFPSRKHHDWRKRMDRHLRYLSQDDTAVDPDVHNAAFDYMRASSIVGACNNDCNAWWFDNDNYWIDADYVRTRGENTSALEAWLEDCVNR